MAEISWSDVTDLIADLPTVPSNGQTTILLHVNNALAEKKFKTSKYPDPEVNPRLKLCRIYLAAHIAVLNFGGTKGAAGPVTSMREGDAAMSFAEPSGGLSYRSFDATSYGKAYKGFLPPSTRGPFVC